MSGHIPHRLASRNEERNFEISPAAYLFPDKNKNTGGQRYDVEQEDKRSEI